MSCDGQHPEQNCLAGVCMPIMVVPVKGWFGRTKRWAVAGYSNHRWHSVSASTRTEALWKWRVETRQHLQVAPRAESSTPSKVRP